MFPFGPQSRKVLRSVDVDSTDIGDGKTLIYHLASGTFRFSAVGTGDMLKATYDTNNDGTVDNAAALGGQAGSYYLNLDNATGTLSMDRIAAGAIAAAKLADEYLPKNTDPGAGAFGSAGAILYWNGTTMTSLAGPGANRRMLASDASGNVDWRSVTGNATVQLWPYALTKPYTAENMGWNAEEDAGSNFENGAGFESADGTLRSATAYWQFPVPLNADGTVTGWATAGGALNLTLVADSISNLDNKLDVEIHRYSGAMGSRTEVETHTAWVPAVANTPEQLSLPASAFTTSSLTAGDIVVVSLTFYSKSNNSVRVIAGEARFA